MMLQRKEEMDDEITRSIRFMRASEAVAIESRFSGADQRDSRLGSVASDSQRGIESVIEGKGRKTSIRCRADVQDIGATGTLQFVGRADEISDIGSSELPGVSGAETARRGAVCVHDRQEIDSILDPHNDSPATWADSAYRSAEQEARLKENGHTSNIHERAYRNQLLTAEQNTANAARSQVRVRVEHVFGHMQTAMNGCYVRKIGKARAEAKFSLENLAYNVSRFTFMKRIAIGESA